MAEKKKQHYVSQFLLRKFGNKDNATMINAYNLKIGKLIMPTAIKGQAQDKFYYGEDLTFENFLSVVEERAAPIIHRICEENTVAFGERKEYSFLLHYLMLYSFRTKANVNKTFDHLNSMFKEIAPYISDFENIDFEHLRLSHPEPAAYNLAYFMDNWVVCADLELFLIINDTEEDFIISDNPLVNFNPLMLRRSAYHLAEGLLNKGLILFLPVSPKHCLMLCDPWAYDVYCAGNTVTLDNIDDLNNINTLQAISADQNIYFTDGTDVQQLVATATKAGSLRENRTISEIIDHPQQKGVKQQFGYYVSHRFCPELSFLREGKEASVYNINEHSDYTRNKEIVDWIKMDKRALHRPQ
ncbi:DUF4238 domain-containing protein [Chitinophaga tropicalis]|uniref:DUF4238 domain-containing protein n=1 Tax=Chitinophaga tropicalis TaxID=2683588 RepID=A0A7K1U572_9BACT|nr:DUF4238 domain-containing protein [Chitinophaga tropicalis]MVT09508.1 DUF4238 domain-containing protein [Chitinophaga tropicalis]